LAAAITSQVIDLRRAGLHHGLRQQPKETFMSTVVDRSDSRSKHETAASASFDLDTFIASYVAMWNEPDARSRRGLVEALWTPDGANVTRSMEVRGHAALEKRVRDSYEKWVRDGGCFFRTLSADHHHGAVRFHWEMVSISGGGVLSVGSEFLLLTADGRIREDYQFILS